MSSKHRCPVCGRDFSPRYDACPYCTHVATTDRAPAATGDEDEARSPDALLERARAIARSGDTDEALKAYAEVLAVAPRHPTALKEVAIGLSVVGNLEDAIHYADRAIAAAPDDPETYDNKAVMLGRQGKFEEALPVIDAGLGRARGHLPLTLRRGNFTARLGRYAASRPYFERALELDPRCGEAMLTLTDVLFRLGLSAEALALVNRALAEAELTQRERTMAEKFRQKLLTPVARA